MRLLYPALLSSLASASQQEILSSNGDVAAAFRIYDSDLSPHHSLRIKEQDSTICNTTVKQYTGWLDHGHKHLFFWYFEQQNASSSTGSENDAAPLMLWLNGGPGASSLLGLFQELGPCWVNDDGDGTVSNPYAWNKDTALLFVDQPVGVGFSYFDGDAETEQQPGDSFASAKDMDIFLRMFVDQVFPVHRNGPVVLSGESYGGHYIPTLAEQVVRQNALHHHQRSRINLKSIAIGNPLVDRGATFFGVWETLCTSKATGLPEPVFNETRCDIMAENLPRCMEVTRTCQNLPDDAICDAADIVCFDGVAGLYHREAAGPPGSRNLYDVSRPCESDVFCYRQSAMINKLLNLPSSWSALGVPSAVQNYSIESGDVSRRFGSAEKGSSTVPSVQFLLENQIDVLVYSGNLDLACNTAGSKMWMHDMSWKGQAAFVAADMVSWTSVVKGKKVKAGSTKEANIKMRNGDEKTTRFALVTVDHAGHMVPQDQPEVALDMISRWIQGGPFV